MRYTLVFFLSLGVLLLRRSAGFAPPLTILGVSSSSSSQNLLLLSENEHAAARARTTNPRRRRTHEQSSTRPTKLFSSPPFQEPTGTTPRKRKKSNPLTGTACSSSGASFRTWPRPITAVAATKNKTMRRTRPHEQIPAGHRAGADAGQFGH